MIRSILAAWADITAEMERLVTTALVWMLPAIAVFLASSVCGLAQLMWEGKQDIPRARKIGAVLSAGIAGSAAFLLLYSRFDDDLPFLIGVSLISGLGGQTTIDLILGYLYRRFGLRTKEKDEQGPTDSK